MYNKKVLSTAVKNLNKAKAPKQPKDIITDPEGQWKFPGEVTRIPGNDITMAGVNYPVLGVSDTGQEIMMYPGMDYTFPGANYVDEYPQMKKGGLVKLPNKSKKGSKSKAYSRSLEATNRLFAENPLFKKSKSRKSKIYDPNAKYYQDGGEYLELDLTPKEIEEYAKGGYIIEDISVPELTKAQKGKIVTPLYIENPLEYKFRKNMYKDSLSLYYAYNEFQNALKKSNYNGSDKQMHTLGDLQGKNQGWGELMLPGNPYSRINPIKEYVYYTGQQPWRVWKYKKPVQPVKYAGKNKLDERYIGTSIPMNYPKAKPVVQEDNSITPLKPKGFENINTPEKLEMPVFPPAQPKKDIRTASRLQTVMELDPNNPGRYKVKELRSVPYSAYFEGEGWQPLTAPGIVWIDEQGNEVSTDPRKVQGPTASFQRGGIKKYQIAGEVTTPVETAPAGTDEVVPVYSNPVYSDVMKWLNENPIYVAPDKPLSINEYEQINTQNMYPKMSGKLLYIPKAGYFNEQQYKVVKEFPVEGRDPIRIYEVVGGEGRKKYIVDDKGFNKEFFSLYQEPKGRTREIYPVYGRGLPYRKYGGILSKMQDGGNFYTLKGSKGVYRKVGDTWEVDWNRTGNFQPISKGNVKERVSNLNKNAQPLYDRDYTTMMGVKSEAPVPQNPFTTNFVNQFGVTDQAIANASAAAPTVENAQKLNRLTQQKAYEDELKRREIAARQREVELLEQNRFTNVPLSQVSDATQMYTDDIERQAIAGAPLAREARKRQAEFEKQQWEKYNKMSTFERIMDRTKGFMVDPLGMTSRALMGEQGYIPGMGEGLLNKDDPDYYKYLVAAGYTPGEFDMFDVQSMVNPMYWGASMGNNINRGNYLDAGIEAALTFAPMVPKGTISQGARMLGDDVSRGVNYLTTQTPLKNAYKINPWAFKPNSEAYYRVLGKEGVNDALESGIIRANPKNIHPFSGEPIYDRPFFSKGVPFDRDWKSPFKNKKGKQSVGSIYPDETMVEVFGHDKFHKTGDLVTSPIDVLNSSDEGINFYKRDWLKGYKEVPKQLPGSANNAVTLGFNPQRSNELGAVAHDILYNNQKVGEVSGIYKGNGDFQIQDVSVDKAFQKKGISKQAYSLLNESLPNNKVVSYGAFVPDEAGIEPGRKLWESLVREGKAKKTGYSYEMLNNKNISSQLPGSPNSKFVSEIDWSKWNPETPKYPELISEYNTIEEATKADGTWMKNPDGSKFKGTPEQFIQQQSSWYKKAFPEGANKVYRGVNQLNAFSDFSMGTPMDESLRGDRGIFTADENLAKGYIFSDDKSTLTPFVGDNKPGLYELIYPKGKQVTYNTNLSDWQEVNLAKMSSKTNIEAQINSLKNILERQKAAGAGPELIKNQEDRINTLQRYYDEFDYLQNDPESFINMRNALGDVTTTDNIADYIAKTNLNAITLQNILDGGLGDVTIVNNRPGNYLKSRVGNVGFFDMTNPNIYKSLIPYIGTGYLGYKGLQGAGLLPEEPQQFDKGGIVSELSKKEINDLVAQGYIIEDAD